MPPQGALKPEQVYALGLRCDHPEAEAIVLSCTDMRTLEVLEALEVALDKPVVSSNQALMHVASKRLGVPSCIPGRLSSFN